MSQALAVRDAGPAVEREVARDMVRRALPVAPVPVLVAALATGVDGALSAAFAVALVVVNLLLSAWLLATAARISYGLLTGVALLGFLVRLALVGVAVWAVKDMGWVEPVPLGLTLVATHLGLLLWELRHVSASLAFPGLRPGATKESASR
ncbi:MAG TPA: ATP synthase subunit I [Acidimicrobiales bacterium]|nr:ATP synthase subunit I [Acidimicrobiales bacterium]